MKHPSVSALKLISVFSVSVQLSSCLRLVKCRLVIAQKGFKGLPEQSILAQSIWEVNCRFKLNILHNNIGMLMTFQYIVVFFCWTLKICCLYPLVSTSSRPLTSLLHEGKFESSAKYASFYTSPRVCCAVMSLTHCGWGSTVYPLCKACIPCVQQVFLLRLYSFI